MSLQGLTTPSVPPARRPITHGGDGSPKATAPNPNLMCAAASVGANLLLLFSSLTTFGRKQHTESISCCSLSTRGVAACVGFVAASALSRVSNTWPIMHTHTSPLGVWATSGSTNERLSWAGINWAARKGKMKHSRTSLPGLSTVPCGTHQRKDRSESNRSTVVIIMRVLVYLKKTMVKLLSFVYNL
jgi:hypothetical protein